MTPTPKKTPSKNSVYGVYSEVHLFNHLSQAVTVGQAELPADKLVNPLFLVLSPFWSFWFTSLSSKTQRKTCETVTVSEDSLTNRGIVLSLFSLQNFPFSSPPIGGVEMSHHCHYPLEPLSKNSALASLSPQKLFQILTLFPQPFLPTHFYHLCACSLPLSACK